MDETDDEIATLIGLANKYMWAPDPIRDRLERAGVNLARSDFYSEVPTLQDLASSFEYTGEGEQKAIFDDDGIFNIDKMARYVDSLVPFAASFAPPIESPSGFFWKNGQFSNTDAMALYALVAKARPQVVIEIGCGYSTFVTRQALRDTGGGRLICIDPEPRADISTLSGVEFRCEYLQKVPVEFFRETARAGDVVFFDGSHSLKSGSDTVYFYLNILPHLARGVIVHAHDVCLPYSPPKNRSDHKLNWGETYVLMAHLQNRLRYKVLFAVAALEKRRPECLDALMHGRYPVWGQSLWYEIVDETKRIGPDAMLLLMRGWLRRMRGS